MYGVFLGHLMVSYINDAHFHSLVYVGKFLEPMFVPFFAILTGAFYNKGKNAFPAYAWLKFGQRMMPVFFYLLLIIPFYIFLPLPGKTPWDSLKWAPLYLLGIPMLSWASWFLVALFTSEMVYFFIQPLARSKVKAVVMALALYTCGWIYNDHVFSFPPVVGMLGMTWMLQAAPLFCAFFLVGSLVKPVLLRMSRWPWWKVVVMGVFAAAISIFAVNMNTFNQPPEGSIFRQFIGGEMVVISTGQYGHYLWFVLSTLGASSTLLCIARLLPVTRFMRACGDHSLVLLGLNGIFLNVLNARITTNLHPAEDVAASVMVYAVVISLLTMAACLPVSIWLERYFPQLTGRPMLAGPILPAIYRKKGIKPLP